MTPIYPTHEVLGFPSQNSLKHRRMKVLNFGGGGRGARFRISEVGGGGGGANCSQVVN